MHWLSEQMLKLRDLSERHTSLRGLSAAQAVEARQAEEARKEFFAASSKTTAEIQQRPGVEACFVAHEGLVCDKAGDAPSFDALAALAQLSVEVARSNAASSLLGEIQQMVLIGVDSKLALFCLGPISIGIRCPSEVNLGKSLSN